LFLGGGATALGVEGDEDLQGRDVRRQLGGAAARSQVTLAGWSKR
jgi:hypothetical protein